MIAVMSSPSPGQAVSLPTSALRSFISHYAGFDVNGLAPGTHVGLPSRHVHIIIGLGRTIDVVRMPNTVQRPAAFFALVGGLQDAPATVRHDGNLYGLHVFLTPLGVRAILGVSAAELASCVYDLADVWGRAVGDLIGRLKAAGTWQQRFRILDQEFLRTLFPAAAPSKLVWAWDRLTQSRGCLSIHSLARDLGWSRRHFSERFRAELGVTPKTAARIFRFERACWVLKHERPSLAETAVACGYHDQAHMTSEWNALAGCAPKAWMARELPILQDYEIAGGDDSHSRSAP